MSIKATGSFLMWRLDSLVLTTGSIPACYTTRDVYGHKQPVACYTYIHTRAFTGLNDLSWRARWMCLPQNWSIKRHPCRRFCYPSFMYYYVHMFRRLRKILPSQLLLNIYKSYVQSKIDYGLSIWGCTTEANLDGIQRTQNLLARIMCNNFDYISFRGIEMVRTLRLQNIRERRDYFLCILMFKCIYGLAPHYLCNDVTVYVDINGYDTSAENMDLYLPRCSREIYKRSFLYKGSSLWNQLPSCLKESISIIDFKRYYTLRWSHHGHDDVSNHQPHHCLLNHLFWCRSKRTSKIRVTGLCARNSPGTGEFPHKWPVTRKMFPLDDIIMRLLYGWRLS